jgi:hypothetical protein
MDKQANETVIRGVEHMAKKEWHEENHALKGYKWSIQAEHGIVTIPEEELFDRTEFQHFTEHEHKASYAVDLGWRWNVDNGKWYRIRGY